MESDSITSWSSSGTTFLVLTRHIRQFDVVDNAILRYQIINGFMGNICWRFHRDDLRSFFPQTFPFPASFERLDSKKCCRMWFDKGKKWTNFELHLTNENVKCLMDQAGRTNAAGSRFSCGRTCLRLSPFWSTRKSFPDIWLKLIMLPCVSHASSLAHISPLGDHNKSSKKDHCSLFLLFCSRFNKKLRLMLCLDLMILHYKASPWKQKYAEYKAILLLSVEWKLYLMQIAA